MLRCCPASRLKPSRPSRGRDRPSARDASEAAWTASCWQCRRGRSSIAPAGARRGNRLWPRTHYAFTERDGASPGAAAGAVKPGCSATRSFPAVLLYGGVLAADAESEAALLAHAEALLKRTGASA